MRYEIINPSDKVFIYSDSLVDAGLACTLLGGGWYALRDDEGETVFPLLAGEKWFEAQGVEDLKAYLEANKNKIAKVLESYKYAYKRRFCLHLVAIKLKEDLLDEYSNGIMVFRWYILRLVYYLPARRFQYRYNTYNPAPKSIKITPKTTKPTPRLNRADKMVNARPPTKQIPGKLLVNALNLNLIILPSHSCFR